MKSTYLLTLTAQEQAALVEVLGGELRHDRPTRKAHEWRQFEVLIAHLLRKLTAADDAASLHGSAVVVDKR